MNIEYNQTFKIIEIRYLWQYFIDTILELVIERKYLEMKCLSQWREVTNYIRLSSKKKFCQIKSSKAQ